jgi:hypothetical protein
MTLEQSVMSGLPFWTKPDNEEDNDDFDQNKQKLSDETANNAQEKKL